MAPNKSSNNNLFFQILDSPSSSLVFSYPGKNDIETVDCEISFEFQDCRGPNSE